MDIKCVKIWFKPFINHILLLPFDTSYADRGTDHFIGILKIQKQSNYFALSKTSR